MLVIDAGNSGQGLEAEDKRRGPMNSKGLAQLANEKIMYVLTAAQCDQDTLEETKLGHGLLTFALVEEGLKTGVSTLLCKRPSFVSGDGCAREGATSLPSPSDVEGFCAFMTRFSPEPAFVPATES